MFHGIHLCMAMKPVYPWLRAPLIRIVPPFAFGISVLYLFPNIIWSYIVCASIVCVFGLIYFFSHAWISGLFLQLLLVLTGMHCMYIQNANWQKPIPTQTQISQLTLLDDGKTSKHAIRFKAQIEGFYDLSTKKWRPYSESIFCYINSQDISFFHLQKACRCIVNMQLRIIPHATNSSAFDFAAYAHTLHIQRRADISHVITAIQPGMIEQYRTRLRSRMEDQLHDQLANNDAEAIARALLYGDDSGMDASTKHDFASNGTLHVLAVSGMHVGIVLLVFQFVFSLFAKHKKFRFIKTASILILIWIYVFICGWSPSILRAGVLITLSLLADVFYLKKSRMNIFFATLFLLLLYDTHMLFQAGFQLSVTAVAGILVYHPIIETWFNPTQRFLQLLWKASAVSISAQVFTFPLSLYYFHQFPYVFLPANLLIVPMTTFVMAIIPLWFVAVYFLPHPFWVNQGFNACIQAVTSVSHFFSNLPFAASQPVWMDLWDCFLVYFSLCFFLIWLKFIRFPYLWIAFIGLSAIEVKRVFTLLFAIYF